jgi:acetoin utilization protein AcuB
MEIKDVMTPCPHYIEASASLDEAVKKMGLQSIRHLPVIEKGALIGIISERDVILSQFVCKTTNYCPAAGDICVSEIYSVLDTTPAAEVALNMAKKKHDCAIVCDKEENVIGIFTTTDACRLIHRILGSKK